MNNGVKWAAILNAVVIIGFVILAIVFKHWWIVLVAKLFLFSYSDDNDKNGNDKK